MSFNGSGTFSRLYNWVTDKTNSVPITASRFDAEMDGMATGLSTAICKDGQTTTTAAIPFAHGAQVSDGTVSAPSVAFISEAGSGFYRIGASNVGFAINGTKLVDYSATGVAITGTFSASGASTLTGNTTVGGTLGVTGAATLSSTLGVAGDIAINTNKFTVAASSGNKAIAGTLTVTGSISGPGVIEDGDVIITFDSAAKTGFHELDGSTITGGATTYPNVAARYAWMVSGSDLILPDMRGYVLRSWDHGAGNDPDAASRTARAGDGAVGDNPGTYQLDQIVSHQHGSPQSYYYERGSGGVTGWTPSGTSVDRAAITATGGNETRMKNINVMYQMKMG